jgi:hypothetical protein
MGLAPVILLYRSAEPSHYLARLGTTAWFDGHGWTEEEALAELARSILEADPSPRGIPADVLTETAKLTGYLRNRAGMAILDD